MGEDEDLALKRQRLEDEVRALERRRAALQRGPMSHWP
jgi:hypothetical protein